MKRNIISIATIISVILTVLSNNVIAQSTAISKDDAYKILQEKIVDGQEK